MPRLDRRHLPVIALAPETSHAAVCLVFEKVNTGGKPLDYQVIKLEEVIISSYQTGGGAGGD